MEVFRSIFAESSSESEPDDPEQQNPSSSDTAVMETELIQTTGTIDTVTTSSGLFLSKNIILMFTQ